MMRSMRLGWVDEHQLILRMLNVMRKACYKLLKTGRYQLEDFQMMIDFVRQYAVLDIIANAIGYTDLLKRHIDKED